MVLFSGSDRGWVRTSNDGGFEIGGRTCGACPPTANYVERVQGSVGGVKTSRCRWRGVVLGVAARGRMVTCTEHADALIKCRWITMQSF